MEGCQSKSRVSRILADTAFSTLTNPPASQRTPRTDELLDLEDSDVLHWRLEGDAWEPSEEATLQEIVKG